MTGTLTETLNQALGNLRVLATVAGDVLAERQVPGVNYNRSKVAGSTGQRIPIRLNQHGQPAGEFLDEAWRDAMRHIAASFTHASEIDCVQQTLAGQGDNLAQIAVDPDVTDEHRNVIRLRLTHAVARRLVDADLHDRLDWEDAVHARQWASRISAAVERMPRYLRLGSRAKSCPGHPLKRRCKAVIPHSQTRCKACQRKVERMKQATADQHG